MRGDAHPGAWAAPTLPARAAGPGCGCRGRAGASLGRGRATQSALRRWPLAGAASLTSGTASNARSWSGGSGSCRGRGGVGKRRAIGFAASRRLQSLAAAPGGGSGPHLRIHAGGRRDGAKRQEWVHVGAVSCWVASPDAPCTRQGVGGARMGRGECLQAFQAPHDAEQPAAEHAAAQRRRPRAPVHCRPSAQFESETPRAQPPLITTPREPHLQRGRSRHPSRSQLATPRRPGHGPDVRTQHTIMH